MGKKDKKDKALKKFDLDNFDPDQEVVIPLSAGEMTLIHYLLRSKLEELEVLYKAGDRSEDTRLSGVFAFSSIAKIEELLKPVAEWAEQFSTHTCEEHE